MEGDCGETISNPAMKLSLDVMIDFFASLVRCMFGGTSWSSSLLLCNYFLTVEGH